MHPTAMHDLAHIRQADYRREAAEHRLATVAKASAINGRAAAAAATHETQARGFGLRAALGALFGAKSTPKVNAI